MSAENNSASGRIHGRVERESNDTVLFISEQGRRIRFRYIGKSQQYPSAAEYQCTQCPVTALMTNAEFRVVDPCAGHDCSVGLGHPQWTPPVRDATTAVNAQQAAATTAPASRASNSAKNTPKVIAKAVYDANGCVTWPSDRYGVTLMFHPKKTPGRRRYFRCAACKNKCRKYKTSLKAFGIKSRDLVVLGENIVGCHPDDAGTTRGHLCQRPLLEEMLKKAKEKENADSATPDIAEVANIGNEDTNSAPQIEATEEASSARPRRSAAPKKPAVFPVAESPARSMEYFSERYQAKLKFVLIGKDNKGRAYYACVKCRMLRGTLKEWGYERFGYTGIRLHHTFVVAGRFVQRPPDECGVKLFTGDAVERRHICQDDKLKKLLDADGVMCKDRREPPSKRKRDATHGSTRGCTVDTSINTQSVGGSRADTSQDDDLDRTAIGQHAGGQAEQPSHATVDEDAMESISEATTTTSNDGSSRQGDADLGPAVNAHDEALQDSGADTRRHNGTDQTLIDQHAGAQAEQSRPSESAVDQAAAEQATSSRHSESSRQSEALDFGPAVDAIDEALQRAERTCSVNSATQCATGSRADTPQQSEVNVSSTQLVVEDERKPCRFDEQRDSASISNSSTPTTLKTDGTSRSTCCAATSGRRKRFGRSPVDVKPPMKKSPEVLTIEDSDEDTDANGTSRTSMKRAKREPDENNDAELRQGDPATRFHTFIREFDFVHEYANYSFAYTGQPAAFLQRPHVMEKWIKFNTQRK